MSTRNTESLNFSVVTTGNNEVDGRKQGRLVRITLEKVLRWIEAKNLDKLVTEELKNSLRTYPENALENWMKNFGKHVSKARRKILEHKKQARQDSDKPDLEACKPDSAPPERCAPEAAPNNPEFD